mgnify:CR=1 FL=1
MEIRFLNDDEYSTFFQLRWCPFCFLWIPSSSTSPSERENQSSGCNQEEKNRNEKLNVSQKNNSRKKCEAKKKIIIIRHVMTRDKTRKWFATKNMKWSNRIFSLNINRKCRKWFWLSFIFIDSFHCNVCRLLFIFSFMIHLFIYPTNQSSIHVEYSVAIIFFLLFSSSYRLNLSMSYCLLEIKIQETKGFSLKYNNRWWVDGWWFGMRQSDLISSNLRINNQWFWFTNTDYKNVDVSNGWYWGVVVVVDIHHPCHSMIGIFSCLIFRTANNFPEQ